MSMYKCFDCGKTENLDAHHIIPAKYEPQTHSPKEGIHTPDNLVALCKSCHRKRHSKGIHRFSSLGMCEKCGKEARDHRGVFRWVVECISCGHCKYGSTRDSSIAAWNRRAKLKEKS